MRMRDGSTTQQSGAASLDFERRLTGLTELPSIEVDGQLKQPHEILLIHQVDPYPGGHDYEWHIPVKFIHPKTLKHSGFESVDRPDRKKSLHWFWWLGSVLGDWNRNTKNREVRASEQQFSFVLNTIDKMSASEGEVIVVGRCSPYVPLPTDGKVDETDIPKFGNGGNRA